MFTPETLISSVAAQGLWIVGLLAVIEGPIATVVAAFLARQGAFDPLALAALLVAADILGDLGFYWIGRRGIGRLSPRWRRRLGLRPARMEGLARQFRDRGGRILVFGKLTHTMGAPILVAAGVARMPVLPFLLINGLASVPKTAALMALGWFAGEAHERIGTWLDRGALAMLVLMVLAGGLWMMKRRPA
ncbi:DedA family protein [Neotabrizicola sp. VNH66]|uniref:DedA family protein n=1 Tax=Neotabrizicola sp. VNH66 TaxID=3400918 RepID=UPI003C0D1431